KLISVEGCARVEILSCSLLAIGAVPTTLEVVANEAQAVRVEGSELLTGIGAIPITLEVVANEAQAVRVAESELLSTRPSSAPGPGLAMILNARGDVWLRGNELNAPLALYGPPGPVTAPLGSEDLQKLRKTLKFLVFPANLRRGLWVSDNQLD